MLRVVRRPAKRKTKRARGRAARNNTPSDWPQSAQFPGRVNRNIYFTEEEYKKVKAALNNTERRRELRAMRVRPCVSSVAKYFLLRWASEEAKQP